MKFRYVGDEYTEWFGFKWVTNTAHDVADDHAIRKLSNSVLFEMVDDSAKPGKKRGARPAEDATQEE